VIKITKEIKIQGMGWLLFWLFCIAVGSCEIQDVRLINDSVDDNLQSYNNNTLINMTRGILVTYTCLDEFEEVHTITRFHDRPLTLANGVMIYDINTIFPYNCTNYQTFIKNTKLPIVGMNDY